MFASKWLDLYHHMTEISGQLSPISTFEQAFNLKISQLTQQFIDENSRRNKQQDDWISHEAFCMVVSSQLPNISLPACDIQKLFGLFFSAELLQLALSLMNTHKNKLTEDDYKSNCGLVYQKLGDYELANTMFNESIHIQPNNALYQNYLGMNALFQGQHEQAIACFQVSLKQDPEFVGGYQNLAGLYYQQSQFEQAAHYCEEAFKKDPTLSSTYITAISSYLALGNYQQADQWVDAAFSHHVTSIELVRLAGIVAHKNGRPEEAIDALNHYLNANPTAFDILHIRAQIKVELGMFLDLESDLTQLLSLETSNEWLLEQLFLCYFEQQKWAEAQLTMIQLSQLSPQYKITHRSLLDTLSKKLSIDILELN